MQNLQYNPFFVMLLGMGTVFVGLICLIYISKVMSFFIGKKKKPDQVEKASAPAAAVASQPMAPMGIANRPQFVAAVSAAIATCMGTEPDGLRIHSIRPMGGAAQTDRGHFVAAVAAAIAVDMGTDINGIRIHSIKRV
ncbi:OadG family protein [Christensenellaceae bacterium OttesenSCG-928-M15]|nr:OadG family protein [Christensenellaceae bacterium OttesenSCG-928-M15]